MNKKRVRELALSNGFKLKQQPSGEMDLNPYVYDFADALLEKANERVKELEKELKESEDALDAAEQQLSSYENALEEVQAVFVDSDACPLFEPFNPRNLSAWLNKFAIEKRVEGAYAVISLLDETKDSKAILMANNYVREQLRKEQE